MAKQIVILDSTQISTFCVCPEQWRLLDVENITAAGRVDDPKAAGSYGHKLLEIYYNNIHQMKANEAAMRALFFDYNKEDKEKSDGNRFPLSDEKINLVRNRFGTYWQSNFTRDFIPLFKTKHKIILGDDGFPKDSEERIPLVEQGFSFKLYEDRDYLFILEGKIDLLCSYLGYETIWVDHKFQFRSRDLYEKRIQFRNYCLATGLSIGVINYIGLQKTINENTFSRQLISIPKNELDWWKLRLIEIYKRVAFAVKSQTFEKNFESCEGKYSKCMFTQICEEPTAAVREAIKKQYYHPKEIWKPW
jgi:hypothetical protein